MSAIFCNREGCTCLQACKYCTTCGRHCKPSTHPPPLTVKVELRFSQACWDDFSNHMKVRGMCGNLGGIPDEIAVRMIQTVEDPKLANIVDLYLKREKAKPKRKRGKK